MNKEIFVIALITILAVKAFSQTPLPVFQMEKESEATQMIDLGKSAFMNSDFEAAVSIFTEALEFEEEQGEVYMYRALSYGAMNQPDLMNNDLDKALANEETYGSKFISMANMFYRLDLKEEAIKLITHGISLEKKVHSMAYIQRARIFQDIKDKRSSCRDYRQAVKLGFSGMDFGLGEYCKAENSSIKTKHNAQQAQ